MDTKQKYDKERVWAEIKARNEALEIELNKIPHEERQRILESNYWGAD